LTLRDTLTEIASKKALWQAQYTKSASADKNNFKTCEEKYQQKQALVPSLIHMD
jgi:hypothetical protein